MAIVGVEMLVMVKIIELLRNCWQLVVLKKESVTCSCVVQRLGCGL
jgi:hypothetical protein